MTLTFTVRQQLIERTDRNTVVADSQQYLSALFIFDTDEWSNLCKTAVFSCGDNHYTVLLVDGECVVPWEIIRAPGFYVSVFGGNRVTVNKLHVPVMASGYIEGETPAEPTPDAYTQLVEIMERQADAAQEAAEAAARGAAEARIEYRIEGDRVGFKRGNESEFTYTPPLTGGSGSAPIYSHSCSEWDWDAVGTRWQLLILAAQHRLGIAVVASVEIDDDEGYDRVQLNIRRLTNDDIVLRADERFRGQIHLQKL